ncbi:MAG: tyrosine--tRNA ligase [Candidatus Levyibacteriota bacterium]|nr:MAG: tyrosine--tRNA ligase [Candidatus Levybacteria bacterium]
MDAITELLTRGVDTIYPDKVELEKVLREGQKLRVYQGFDPTSPQFHIGHMVGLRKLSQWQNLGHEVIFLIGDFTAMTGDPTGKDKTRIPLTREQVLENAKTYKEQASKILNFSGKNPTVIKYNSDWLAKMSVLEFANLAYHLSLNQIIKRDMFQKRIANNMDISMTEIFYPLMQGYDSVAMNVDVEVGGSDQMFNMMTGRDLMHKIKRKNKFVMTTPLLTDSQGVKIGKTEGNSIALTDKPEDLFGKIMTLPDDVMQKGFEYLTDVPMDEINSMNNDFMKNKKRLAYEIVKQLNNESAAKEAERYFEKTVQKKEIPSDIKEFSWSTGKSLVDFLTESKLATSKTDAKRLIEQGGVAIDEEIITDSNAPFSGTDDSIVRVGKRKFIRVSIK